MQILLVSGGAPLEGTVFIHGAKNSVLPILSACALCGGECVLRNCPDIDDVKSALQILRELGCRVRRSGGTLYIDPSGASGWEVSAEMAGKMRSSVIFLGALLAKRRRARLYLPGGCPLGRRPVDLHVAALGKMGAEFCFRESEILCRAESLRGCTIRLPYPSVGATENVLLAAMGCEGETRLENAAREPEIFDLVGFLRAAGADISLPEDGVIVAQGGLPLHGAAYSILPDRIETASYLCAAAACGGDVTLKRARSGDLRPVIEILRGSGCRITDENGALRICSEGRLRSAGLIRTEPYPGFPTDAQAPVMAALLRAEGETLFEETVFEERFRHVPELRKMGAAIEVSGRAARVTGVPALHGAAVRAEDLRGGAALLIAALSAEGKSVLSGVKHLHRGYDHFEENLQKLGARMKCVDFS
jgi:UDP-N-acetylglucosamine 1-carboxyvinyltransferase